MASKRYKSDVGRLCNAMRKARKSLQPYRRERREAVREYVGTHYSDDAATKRVPMNLLSLYISIVSRNLIAKNPRVMLSTFEHSRKPAVAAMQDWANDEIEEMRLAESLRRIVLDALFSVGIGKCALADPGDAASRAWNLEVGAPFVERIDLDDFVFDVHARDFSEVSFIGHRFRVPIEAVRDSARYNKARKDLSVSDDLAYDQDGEERVSMMGRGYVGGLGEEYKDMVDLWEIYCPRDRLVMTLADDNISGASASDLDGDAAALLEQRWLGPDDGPYEILGYEWVPGNPMPKGPVQNLIDIHTNINQVMRKLLDQSQRQKEVGFVQGAADQDGSRILNADDGDFIRVDNPDRIKVQSMGGPNAQLFALMTSLTERFSWLAGNLEIMGGLSAQSKTATQDTMLNANSLRGIADMQDSTVTYAARMIKKLCWFWWHHPQKVMRSSYKAPGVIRPIDRAVYPGMHPDARQMRREGRFEDLKIKVDPYSMQHATPQQRAKVLTDIVTQVYAPLAQIAQRQGVALDLNAFFEKIGEYADMPDLGEILTMQQPPADGADPAGGSTGSAGPGPAQTTRTYVRENMPGRTPAGNNMNLVNQLMGVNPGGAPNGQQNGSMPQ